MPAGTTTSIGTMKIAWYFGAIAIFEYLNIPQEQLTILAILMAIDFATWIGKQGRIDPAKITSYEMGIWFLKKIATLIAVLSIAFVFKGLWLEWGIYIKMILGVFIMAEWYSIIQNVYAIRTGKILPEYDVVSILLKSLGDYLKYRIEKSIKIATQNPFPVEEKKEKQTQE